MQLPVSHLEFFGEAYAPTASLYHGFDLSETRVVGMSSFFGEGERTAGAIAAAQRPDDRTLGYYEGRDFVERQVESCMAREIDCGRRVAVAAMVGEGIAGP